MRIGAASFSLHLWSHDPGGFEGGSCWWIRGSGPAVNLLCKAGTILNIRLKKALQGYA